MNCFLGIDLGTSYFKTGIFDETGHLKGLGRQSVHKVSDGITCELPVDVFWKTLRTCLDEALQMAGIRATAIRSLSYATQANSFVLLDARHQPLTPLILWPDKRAAGMAPPVGDKDELLRRTGLGGPPNLQFTMAKLNWFQKKRPDIWEKTAHILSISDYLTFSLTGQKMCDYSTAAMSGLFDIMDGAWWNEQLDRSGIQADMLPTPQRTGVFAGVTTSNAVNLTGLPAGISFSLGGLDHHMAAIGAGIPSNRYSCESTGTVLSCVDYTDDYHPQKDVYFAPGLHAGSFFRMMFDDNGATSLEWYQKNYAPAHTIPALLAMASQVEPGCDGLKALPCADTYPGLNGFKPAYHDRYGHGHYVRALLESTAHSLQQIVVAMKNPSIVSSDGGSRKKDSSLTAIVSSGGGSRSELWVNIKSRIIKKPFFIPECTDLASMGAAMTGALGSHAFNDCPSLADLWVRYRKVCSI